MSCQKPPVGMSEDTKIRGSPRKDQDMRGAAILHQQRRLKQATQFVHKDSADLLPLDQLRRLGTSKDLQPHCVIQRRLLGGSPIKETSNLAHSLNFCNLEVQSTNEPDKVGERIDEDQLSYPDTSMKPLGSLAQRSLLINCRVCTQDVSCKLSIDCYENLISRSCMQRLGLQMLSSHQGRVIVNIEVGKEKLTSSAVIVDDGGVEFSIGLDTLVKFKSCIDLEHGVLKTPSQVIPFLTSLNKHPEAEKTSNISAPNQ
ncbi:nuclear receptor-interacting protein 3-like [Mantella aurantiaca]